MPALRVQVRAGGRSKTLPPLRGRHIYVGRRPDSDLLLPFPWVKEIHLVIENSDDLLRVKLGDPDARATMGGAVLTTDWQPIESPATIELAVPDGQVLAIEVASADAETHAAYVRSAPAAAAEGRTLSDADLGVQMATLDGMVPQGRGWLGARAGAEPGQGDDGEPAEADDGAPPLPPAGLLARSPRLVVGVYGAVMAALVLAALGFNYYRRAAERDRVNDDVALVTWKVQQAKDYVGRKQYAAAKGALDAAEPVARRRPVLADALAEIERLRAKPEIQLGAQGYEPIDGQWVPGDTARQVRAARERDDPKIARLEEDAGKALAAKDYEATRQALEQALAMIDAHPGKAHPKQAALKAQLATVKAEQTTAEMIAKGYVQQDGRWISKEEKFKLDQQAKGLVEFEGAWMTPEQAAEARRKGGTGRIFYQGKWMTPDEKMEADGYVKFEGQWMKPEKRQELLAVRQQESERRQQEQARTAALRQEAYAASQEAIRKQLVNPARAAFEPFAGPDVRVVQDQGWFLVKGTVDQPGGTAGKKLYYCKLKPGATAGSWEVESAFLMEP